MKTKMLKSVATPEDILSPPCDVLGLAKDLAKIITDELATMPGMAPGATQYPAVARDVAWTDEVLTRAVDLLGHAEWLDVRIEPCASDEDVLLVSITVPGSS